MYNVLEIVSRSRRSQMGIDNLADTKPLPHLGFVLICTKSYLSYRLRISSIKYIENSAETKKTNTNPYKF